LKGEGSDDPFPIRVGRGSRAVEAALLDEIQALADAGERDPRLLGRPVRVVVPSASLRAHLLAALMRRRGRAIAGLQVQTLRGLALEILERAGETPRLSEALFPVLVRRLARRERALRENLDELVDGYGIVAENVTDLLDAGFSAAHEEALADAASELAAHPSLVARTQATLRVAAGTIAALDELGIGHRSQLLERARVELERDPSAALPSRAVLIHGFAEATGLGAELLEALVRHTSARVHLDSPPDPASAAAVAWRFPQRLESRLSGIAGVERVPPSEKSEVTLVAWKAPGAEAEVRAAAVAIRERLDAGHPPETLGIVARDLRAYRAPLRDVLGRYGIPFSGVGEKGSAGVARRRMRAVLDLLQGRGRVPADRWLDAVFPARAGAGEYDIGGRALRADLRLGLRHLGSTRLEDAANPGIAKRDLRLPVVGTFRDGDAEEDVGEGARAERRTLPKSELAQAFRAAKRTLAALDRLAAAGEAGTCLERFSELLVDALGWSRDRPECAEVFDAIDSLGEELPPDFALDGDEFLLILRRAFERVGVEPIGGAGGGVQILTVMEARARTFDSLYLLGLNRDVFPRNVQQDPLLPDTVRRALGGVLPDLPIKATGHEEERYLFAQLLSASPEVTLSWQTTSDDGRECAPSTFVERLRWAAREIPSHELSAPNTRNEADVVGAGAFAVRAGLFGSRANFAEIFSVAMEEVREGGDWGTSGSSAAEIANGRLAVLTEIDRPASSSPRLGPFDGFIGAIGGQSDPRRRPVYITTAENIARCPWQAFLAKLLRLQPPPDPLAVLPGSDPRLLGMVVHRTLERVVGAGLAGAPDSLEGIDPVAAVPVAWPAPETLEASLREAASDVLADEGIAWHGLARVLVDQARPYVQRAGELDWPEGPSSRVDVMGVEVEGSVAGGFGNGGISELRFRADRVDAFDGTLRITDYKTGAPISAAVTDKTRAAHFLTAVSEGRHLQAVAYARGAGVANASGRFLFLRPDLDENASGYSAGSEDEEMGAAFAAALERVGRAWGEGAFGPRLLDASLQGENAACERCELALACVRGDSGARGRLVNWLARAVNASPEVPERALFEVWELQAAKGLAKPESAS